MPSTFVIVGASLAGASAALTLRDEGFDGRIVLIGAEPDLQVFGGLAQRHDGGEAGGGAHLKDSRACVRSGRVGGRGRGRIEGSGIRDRRFEDSRWRREHRRER